MGRLNFARADILEVSQYLDPVTASRASGVQNVANIETPLLSYSVPAGQAIGLPRVFRPQALKLYTTGGAQIARNSEIIVYRQKAGSSKREELGRFTYGGFYPLSEVEQADKRNDNVLTKALHFGGRRVPRAAFQPDDTLHFYIVSPQQVDFDNANTVMVFDVEEVQL